MKQDKEPIAIIGVGCRFPGAANPESFWQLLHDGVDAITEVPPCRWDVNALYDPDSAKPDKMNIRWGGFLEHVDQFDPQFFSIAPREAVSMDPKQRLLLEVAWEALEDAGQIPEHLAGTQTGVFVGISSYDYYELLVRNSIIDAYGATGNNNCIAAHRISYVFDFTGPSVAIDTACSSSLVAVHLACQSLWSGECTMALVGGVHVMLSPWVTLSFAKGGFLAPDGRCKTFDARANGYVRGEGAGVVVLKPLSQAQADGDSIYAVVRGSAINQDGRSNGLTAPNPRAQESVLREAYRQAGVAPSQVQYIEAHGTGTILGDPIEMKALGKVLAQDRVPGNYCAVGSTKTNIGHLEAAAGIAGLIKVALSLKHRLLPPSLHFREPNPYIPFNKLLLRVQQTLGSWPEGTGLALAGVSSFGFGGTNAHVVLEEAPGSRGEFSNPKFQIPTPKLSCPLHILTLSAKSELALRELAQRYQEFLTNHPTVSLADVCFTANTRRSHFDHRLCVVLESTLQLQGVLSAFAAKRETDGLVSGKVQGRRHPKIAFLFTGQGSQYVGMGLQLYETQPTFRQTLDRCDEILRPYLEKPLLKVLYPELEENSPLDQIDQTAYTQPALFALEYALSELWKSWGITPDVVMGHSVGEYVAACVAGVFSLEDGLKLIAKRGRLMQALPQDGEMVAVLADEARVTAAIQPYSAEVAIAAINGPQNIVISGNHQAVEAVITTLQAEGAKTKRLNVTQAFHSPLMKPMLAAFQQVASEVTYSSPKIGLISNVTGGLATVEIATPEYWCRHVLKPVRFAAGMETLHQQGYEVFVECGPRSTLLGMGRNCLPEGVGVWLPSLRQGQSDWQQSLHSLAGLYVRGVTVDWSGFDRDYPPRYVQLPTYPFQRQRYWIETAENQLKTTGLLSLEQGQTPIVKLLNYGNIRQLAQQLETVGEFSEDEVKLLPKLLTVLVKHNQQQLTTISLERLLYQLEWQPKPRRLQTALEGTQAFESGSWLILADRGGMGQALAELLQSQGQTCLLVYPGDGYKSLETGIWSLNPANLEDFERLFQEVLRQSELPLRRVVHLWSLEAEQPDALTIPSLEQAQILGCGSILHLVQTLVKHNQSASPRLWLVTRGVQPVESQKSSLAVAQAPLWGLGKVVALEHPQLWGGMLDLATPVRSTGETPASDCLLDVAYDEAATLLTEIWDSLGEDHLAFRQGQRYVARLVHTNPPEPQFVRFRSDASYLITGGLGALGLKVAQWMVKQGARNLVLSGRSGASSQAQSELSQLEQAGAKVIVAQADVSNQEDMVRMLEEVQACMPPLRGIVHAAGIFDDGILLQQDWERFTRVMNPKVAGAWNLHTLTQNLPLDFFVCFSSVASLLGSPGQGNYAAANAFMDVLAYYRQAHGLPGLSINWGQWADAGMAASLDSRCQARLAAMGLGSIAPEQGLSVLELVVGQAPAQVGVLPFEWSVFRQQFSAGRQLPLLSELVAEAGPQQEALQASPQRHELLQRLSQAPASERYSLLIAHIQEQVVKALGFNASQLDLQLPLNNMGLDSLMALELRNRFKTDLGVDVPIVEFMEGCSVASLATLVSEQLTQAYSTSSASLTTAATPSLCEQKATQVDIDTSKAYPLSHGQRALWFLYQLAPEIPAYHFAFTARILSSVDVPALRRAFQAMIARHSCLRTNFTTRGGEPVQELHAYQEVCFEETDASTWTWDELTRRVREAYQRPFDLERGSVLRVNLFTRSVNDYILLLTIHHIAVDAWSFLILLNELRLLYPAERASTAVSLPPIKWQYTDYVQWQAETLASPVGERLWAYWQKQLAGKLPVLNMPTDRPRPPVQTYQGTSYAFKLTEELTQRLKELVWAEGTTLYMTLLAAFQVLLHRYTGQEDILVGSPTAGRSQAEFAGIVGYLVNPLVLRADLSGNPTFKTFLSQIRHTVLAAIAHQDYPFPLLVERLQPKRDPSRSPIFQVWFVLQKPQQPEDIVELLAAGETGARVDWGGLSLEPFELAQQEGHFDLTLEMVEARKLLLGVFKYNTDLFDASTISRMAEHFQTLLEGIVANPEQRVSELPLLTAAKQHQLKQASLERLKNNKRKAIRG
ncbi:MAG: SDR family NAD(P)-dependent oxidoreductase [Nostoc indistinguendum CM1-VF10]|jgi:malonyl CoA-acyl carrier protein transacylase|nr:SDR family NAD(P)-dependent oxidoreductase [Nostoc indistinguendum CM1-VF10]